MPVTDRLRAALADRYLLVRELGGGGMSHVWLARERALGRDVVIKVVGDGTDLSADRFAREVQLAARLQQANIVPLLTAGEAEGLPYYTMPYVEGESLRARLIVAGAMPVAEMVSVVRDVARALAYAHERGVVHRDIKPENILLSGGAAVVTDFGIAKAISEARTMAPTREATGMTTDGDDGLTREGTSLGTPAYMAPEQIAADPAIDHRADLYALGCVAYELLAGAPPFSGRGTAQLLAAHLAEAPMPLAERRRDLPPTLVALVMRCLAKAPDDRPATARDVVAALDAVATSGANVVPHEATHAASRPGHARASRTRSIIVTVLLVAVAGVAWTVARKGTATATVPDAAMNASSAVDSNMPSRAPEGSIAVLPFVNLSGSASDEYFSDGLTDELANAIRNLPGLRLAGRSSSFAFKGKNLSAMEIGRTLSVRTLVEGTVRRSGSRVRLAAQLTSTANGEALWSEVFENAGGDVFAVQDAFTRAVVARITPLLARGGELVGDSSAPGAPLMPRAESRGTTDAVAYDLYLRGRYLWAQRGAAQLDSALLLLRQAVARDPRFARGWAALALTHVLRPNYDVLVAPRTAFDSAMATANRALALDSTLADAWTTIGLAHLRRLEIPSAERAMARARALEPQNPTLLHWSAFLYSAKGELAQAQRQRDAAMARDPLSAAILNNVVIALVDQRRFTEARVAADRLRAMSLLFTITQAFNVDPIPAILTGTVSQTWAQQQRLLQDSALRVVIQRMRGVTAGRLLTAAASQQWAQARVLRDSIMAGRNVATVAWDRAIAALVFGTRAEAARYFEVAFTQEGAFGNLVFSMCAPVLDLVRDEPSWRAFVARQGLPLCDLRSSWPDLRAPENRR